MRRVTTYSDESGIITRKKFIVATAIVNNKDCETFQQLLQEIEQESGKRKKWTDVGVETRARYTKLLLKKRIFSICTVYFAIYNSQSNYVSLVSSQVAKSILNYANTEEYIATIFLDKVNKKITTGIQKDIKRYKIRFKKIRALDDTNNVGLKFIDAICGLIRDINNKDIDDSYGKIYKKLKEV